jgi:hypothetical protein
VPTEEQWAVDLGREGKGEVNLMHLKKLSRKAKKLPPVWQIIPKKRGESAVSIVSI